jgi:hypothetical protein
MIIKWDSAYEATPGSNLVRSLIDDEIRQMTYGVRERMSQEHRWGPFGVADTDPETLSFKTNALDEGSHLPGGTTICDIGDSTDRDAIVTPQLGALFVVYADANYEVNIYTTEGWTALSTMNHADLVGREDNDHQQYVLKSGGVMTGNLDMGGYTIETQETGQTLGTLALYKHRTMSHGTIEDIRAITDGAVTFAKLKTTQSEITVSLPDYTRYQFALPLHAFFPQVYALNDIFSVVISPCYELTSQHGWALVSGVGTDVRIRYEWIV